MGTFLAAATHAPLTAIFLLFELTRDYNVVVPILVSAITATIVARRMVPASIDEYELQRRGLFRTEYEGATLRDSLGLARPENRFFAGEAAAAE